MYRNGIITCIHKPRTTILGTVGNNQNTPICRKPSDEKLSD